MTEARARVNEPPLCSACARNCVRAIVRTKECCGACRGGTRVRMNGRIRVACFRLCVTRRGGGERGRARARNSTSSFINDTLRNRDSHTDRNETSRRRCVSFRARYHDERRVPPHDNLIEIPRSQRSAARESSRARVYESPRLRAFVGNVT